MDVRRLTAANISNMQTRSNTRGLRLNGCHLSLRFCALFEFHHLLTLNRRGSDFVSEDDVSDFAGGRGSNIDTVSLSEIRENEVLQCNFHLNPFVVGQSWPDEMRLRDGGLVGPENNLRFLIVDMKPT